MAFVINGPVIPVDKTESNRSQKRRVTLSYARNGKNDKLMLRPPLPGSHDRDQPRKSSLIRCVAVKVHSSPKPLETQQMHDQKPPQLLKILAQCARKRYQIHSSSFSTSSPQMVYLCVKC